ncbi:MAG TPA: lytic transglycosylase F [Vicinamibacterales bacterium]|nr:lytic transglycosylase F [Vicinamibacterales bacterium]
MRRLVVLVLLTVGFAFSAGAQTPPAKQAPPAKQPSPAKQAEAATTPLLSKPWTGDLDGMIQRRIIRVATTYNRTNYFIDRGQQRGAVYESFRLFEDELNTKLKTKNLRVQVVFIPMSRDELLKSVVEGRADIAAATLTVTPEREKLVDFVPSTYTDINEIVVTGPGAPAIKTAEDLSGKEVFVRRSSSYFESLTTLNAQLKAKGQPPVVIKPAPEELETEDILEMVNAGLVKITVADDHLAGLWKQVLPSITLVPTAAVRTGGKIAPAIRKNSPQLMAEAAGWIKRHGPKTMFGNMMVNRYVESAKFVKSATGGAEMKRFQAVVELFRKYGDQYKLDFLLMLAQGFQESGLDHAVKSPVGAIGVMQVMPATGKELKVGDIQQLENNVHAGVKYMRFMVDQYYKDEPMDDLNKGLFAFASYNAGPGRMRQLRAEAQKRGLNPNIWFNNVERVASERIGRETVTYVANIYKYYIAYRLSMEEMQQRQKAKGSGSEVH